MIHPITGIYAPPARGVDRIAGNTAPPVRPEPPKPSGPQDLMAYDSVRVASISDTASRTMSYQLAVRNLDEIGTYLGDLF